MTVPDDRALVLFEPKPNNIYNFDALQLLRLMPDESVNCIVTSPPYFGLRDYGVDGQIGLEETPEQFVDALVRVFREARRVLRSDGVFWLNLGDTYAGGGRGGNPDDGSFRKQATNIGSLVPRSPIPAGIKAKDLIGIPWMVAFALRADGWYLRSEIIWHKPNPMPESVTDRPTKAHEQVFLLAKSASYWYDADAIKEPAQDWGERDRSQMRSGTNDPLLKHHGLTNGNNAATGRNKRSVWTISTKPFRGAHFATFPPDLIEPMILAGCPARVCAECGKPWERVVESTGHVNRREPAHVPGNSATKVDSTGWAHTKRATETFCAMCACNADTRPGLVYDPFMGAGTTAVEAQKLGRQYLGSEINPEYLDLARMRVDGRMDEYLARQRGELHAAYMFEGGAA